MSHNPPQPTVIKIILLKIETLKFFGHLRRVEGVTRMFQKKF